MKYKQICPDCYYEMVINSIEEAAKECPKCWSRSIASQKIITVDVTEDFIIAEEKQVDSINDEEHISTWEEILQVEDLDIDRIKLAYMGGLIKEDFVIELNNREEKNILGRSGIGKEYFQADTHIGNEHCLILYENHKWYIRDNNSRNGTLVNNRLLEPQVDKELNNGDIIQFGKAETAVKLRVVI